MPTAIPSGYKTCFINTVSYLDVSEASALPSILNNYEDLPAVLNRELLIFNCNLNALLIAMACFATPSALTAVGIYVGSSGPTLTDPSVVINSAITTINCTAADGAPRTLLLLGPATTVSTISLAATVKMLTIYIGPGVTVNRIDATASGASVNVIQLKSCAPDIASLQQVLAGSAVQRIVKDAMSFYGGTSDYNPNGSCTHPVTAATVTDVTNTGFKLSWTNPSSTDYLYIIVDIKKTSDLVWLDPTGDFGEMIGDNVFMFANLEPDTYYDYRITSYCTSGIPSTPVTGSQQTTCI